MLRSKQGNTDKDDITGHTVTAINIKTEVEEKITELNIPLEDVIVNQSSKPSTSSIPPVTVSTPAPALSSVELRDSVFGSDTQSDSEEEEEEEESHRESQVKRRRGEEEEELKEETEKHNRLSRIYERQKYMIARLKEYYLESLQKRKFRCAQRSRPDPVQAPAQPLVVIKTEIDIEQDPVIKTETLDQPENT